MKKLKIIRLVVELLLLTAVGWLWVISDLFSTSQLFVDYFFYAFGLFFVGILLNKYTRKFLIMLIPPLGSLFEWTTPRKDKQ